MLVTAMTLHHLHPRWPLERSEVLIVGVARNCSRTLSRDIARLRSAFSAAQAIKFFIVESDSTDKTVEELDRLSRASEDVMFTSLGSLSGEIPRRAERIAFCRNHYLDEICSNPRFSSASYVVVADLDGVNSDLNQEAVASCWAAGVDWDVCTANQADFYYDVWALRHPSWCPDDCWEQYRALCDLVDNNQALEAAVHSRMLHIETGAEPIEVDSAFGGLAIYKRAALLESRYLATQLNGRAVCEHVPLHDAIRRAGYRIFINPALINTSATPHSWHKKRVARMFRSMFPNVYRPDPDGTSQKGTAYARLRKIRQYLQ
jgi:hypothetical protein